MANQVMRELWYLKTDSPERVVIMVHFTTISGHFLANPFKIFHKTEVLLVVLNKKSLSFVKNIRGVGQKMTRNGPKMIYSYSLFR